MKLVIRTEKETMTSLELVDKINELRKEENNLKELQRQLPTTLKGSGFTPNL